MKDNKIQDKQNFKKTEKTYQSNSLKNDVMALLEINISNSLQGNSFNKTFKIVDQTIRKVNDNKIERQINYRIQNKIYFIDYVNLISVYLKTNLNIKDWYCVFIFDNIILKVDKEEI